MKHSFLCAISAFIIVLFSFISPSKAVEYNFGDHLLGANMGLAFPTSLSPARAMMAIDLEYQYFWPKSFSLALGLNFATAFSQNQHLLGEIGGRYHLMFKNMPMSMCFGLGFVGGGIFDMNKTNYGYVGGKILLGSNYFFKENLSTGLNLICDIGSAISDAKNNLYAIIGLVLVFNYRL